MKSFNLFVMSYTTLSTTLDEAGAMVLDKEKVGVKKIYGRACEMSTDNRK